MTNLFSLSKVPYYLTGCAFCIAGCVLAPFSYISAALAVAFLGAVFVSLQCVKSNFKEATSFAQLLGRGDFETRITDINEASDAAALFWSLNDMADTIDAYIRESSAAMEYVSHNQYFRRILENGLEGSMLNGARIINRATQSVADKMKDFGVIANDVDQSLKNVVEEIGTAVETLEVNANSMEQTVENTRQGSDSAVSGANEASMNVQTISAAIEELSASIAEISEQITRTASISGQAVKDAESTRLVIGNLAESANSINEVTNLIEEIAEQTNLLALNATIEAARAGEAGKGFAVVASEVKDLASETAKATEEIRTQIDKVQDATQNAVSAFDGIGATISQINEASSIVAATIEEQNAATKDIAQNAERASSSTTAAAQEVQNIGSEIMRVNEISQHVMQATNTLSTDSRKKIEDLLVQMEDFMAELSKIS
ncbi:MAG: methyl-accepting chemotaxis protein [Alphaproteobacteria bacterium]